MARAFSLTIIFICTRIFNQRRTPLVLFRLTASWLGLSGKLALALFKKGLDQAGRRNPAKEEQMQGSFNGEGMGRRRGRFLNEDTRRDTSPVLLLGDNTSPTRRGQEVTMSLDALCHSDPAGACPRDPVVPFRGVKISVSIPNDPMP